MYVMSDTRTVSVLRLNDWEAPAQLHDWEAPAQLHPLRRNILDL